MIKNYWYVDRTLETKGKVVLKDTIGSYYSYTIDINDENSIVDTKCAVSQLFMLPIEARQQAIKFLDGLLDKLRI